MRSHQRGSVLLDLKGDGSVTTGPVVVKKNGSWRIYPGRSELHLGTWSVWQDGERLVLVLDGFDLIGDERFKALVIGHEQLAGRPGDDY